MTRVSSSFKKRTEGKGCPRQAKSATLWLGLVLIFGGIKLFQCQNTTVSTSSVDKDCQKRIRSVLTSKEQSNFLDSLICSNYNPLLADLILSDRSKIRKFERQAYLKDLRSYRLSGLICNDHTDPSIPPVASEPAFKCLPAEYKRRACMDGRMSSPNSCTLPFSGDRGQGANPKTTPYVPEPERISKKFDCDSPGANCAEYPMGTGGRTGVDDGQLAKDVPESKLLTMRSDGRPVWHPKAVDLHLKLIREGKDVSPLHYPGAHRAIQKAVDFVKINNKSVAIFGSITPWVESIVLHNRAKLPIITVDYNQPKSLDKRLQTELMTTMLENEEQFDVAISYSSIEHDGQGRYGDPLDPDGDFAAIKEIWLKVAPGGYLLLNVPTGNDQFHWYSMRVYGPARLPLLTRGWEYYGLATGDKVFGPDEAFMLSEVPNNGSIVVLRKPQSVGADDLLDLKKFQGLKCDSSSKKCNVK